MTRTWVGFLRSMGLDAQRFSIYRRRNLTCNSLNSTLRTALARLHLSATD